MLKYDQASSRAARRALGVDVGAELAHVALPGPLEALRQPRLPEHVRPRVAHDRYELHLRTQGPQLKPPGVPMSNSDAEQYQRRLHYGRGDARIDRELR